VKEDEKNSAVFISGGTSGFGLKLVEHFVRKGRSVIFCGRNQATIDQTLAELEKLVVKNRKILGFQADVGKSLEVSAMFEIIKNSGTAIDVLICNAGVIGPINKFLECDQEKWLSAFETNLYGTSNLILEALPDMLVRQFGKIIHVSGGGATSPLFGMSSYAASKAAAVRFIETLAFEYADSGVTFNSIAPGMLKTKLLDQMLKAGPKRIGNNLFTKSILKSNGSDGIPALAIQLVDFLASDLSQGINGKLISAEWDDWSDWPQHLAELKDSDIYTLRRIVGRDRGKEWGDL
jgi:NAD(P)-dependent dehydrogenase (short-subunit alcohol dehydrogenase family)